jgi:O-antigen/teichoic acid export membrane protein
VEVRGGRPAAPAQVRWRAGLADASTLALAGIAGNGGSLLVTVVLARLLSSSGYGALNQLVGIFFVVSTPGSAVLVAVVRRLARWQGTAGAVWRWGAAVHGRATVALVLFAGAVLAAGPSIAGLLGRRDALGVDAVAIAGGVWVLLCVDRGLLQASRSYRTLSANLLLEGGARTAFMIGFGAAGLGVRGVAAGVLVAEVCTAAHARLLADRAWRPEAASGRVGTWWRAHRPGGTGRPGRDGVVRRDLLAAAVALGAVALLQNVDVIVMGREAPRAAGGYAAVSVASKAIVFVAVALAGYLLPEAAISWREGRDALRQLTVSLALLGAPAALLVGVAAAVPRPFLQTVFSGRYAAAAGAFLPLALAMVCLGVTVVVTTYLLGVGDRSPVGVLVGGAAVAAAAMVLAHGVPEATALADLGVQVLVMCATGARLARLHRSGLPGSATPSGTSDAAVMTTEPLGPGDAQGSRRAGGRRAGGRRAVWRRAGWPSGTRTRRVRSSR